MHRALSGLSRYIATPLTAKHRLFVWVPAGTIPSHALGIVAREDDYTFGVLQSHIHEMWALAAGSQLETRPRYTPTTTFETFPFPDPTPEQRRSVGEAARRLVDLRDGWLNPPATGEPELRQRTLTDLYNKRPAWLDYAHEELDTLVMAAYRWSPELSDDEILELLLDLNEKRAGNGESEVARPPAGRTARTVVVDGEPTTSEPNAELFSG
jgi:hypothetical protein